MPAPYSKDLFWRVKLPILACGLGLWDVIAFFMTTFFDSRIHQCYLLTLPRTAASIDEESHNDDSGYNKCRYRGGNSNVYAIALSFSSTANIWGNLTEISKMLQLHTILCLFIYFVYIIYCHLCFQGSLPFFYAWSMGFKDKPV